VSCGALLSTPCGALLGVSCGALLGTPCGALLCFAYLVARCVVKIESKGSQICVMDALDLDLDICMVCLDSDGNKLIQMCECSMRYHRSCFIRWLNNKTRYNCEICGGKYKYGLLYIRYLFCMCLKVNKKTLLAFVLYMTLLCLLIFGNGVIIENNKLLQGH